jgi:hypothetical protein
MYFLKKAYAQLNECGSARCVCLQINTQISVKHNASLLFFNKQFCLDDNYLYLYVYNLYFSSSPK